MDKRGGRRRHTLGGSAYTVGAETANQGKAPLEGLARACLYYMVQAGSSSERDRFRAGEWPSSDIGIRRAAAGNGRTNARGCNSVHDFGSSGSAPGGTRLPIGLHCGHFSVSRFDRPSFVRATPGLPSVWFSGWLVLAIARGLSLCLSLDSHRTCWDTHPGREETTEAARSTHQQTQAGLGLLTSREKRVR